MKNEIFEGQEYKDWILQLKNEIRGAQIKASMAVNSELLQLYWQLGLEIIEKEKTVLWGEGLIPQMAKDLGAAFPGIKGFSRTNLFYIRKWVDFYAPLANPEDNAAFLPLSKVSWKIIPQLVGQIPWGHHRELVTHCKSIEEASFYIHEITRNNWSRVLLSEQIKNNLFLRAGKAINNFSSTLPLPLADLARETLKNPYCFDFLNMGEAIYERDLEKKLIDHIQRFLLELGAGFAYIGRQYPLSVGESDFFLDLLFYHTRLRCYVVVELKIAEFQPEFVGKLNFYLNAVDAQLKHVSDQPTLGLLLCKTPDKIIVDYSLRNITTPLGVSEYNLTKELPKDMKTELPSIDQITSELIQKGSTELL